MVCWSWLTGGGLQRLQESGPTNSLSCDQVAGLPGPAGIPCLYRVGSSRLSLTRWRTTSTYAYDAAHRLSGAT
jgi:hypothetical protein